MTLSPELFQGAVSIERRDGWCKPWRLPCERRWQFPAAGLLARAEMASGVRLRFQTDSRCLRLAFLPLPKVAEACRRATFAMDVTCDGELLASEPVPEGGESAQIGGLPAGLKTLEVWLPQDAPVHLRRMEVDDGASCSPVADPRPRWVTYGSSLTHCVRAHSPARTWPAIIARRHGLNLTCLGFGGECHLEATLGIVIRDLPADVITLKLGINTISGSLNARTFPSAVMGLVALIRERHPHTPLGLVSPIAYPPRETEPNAVGYTIGNMRQAIQDVQRRCAEAGDGRIHYYNGLEVAGPDLIARYSVDQCHPDADGIEVQAENFDRTVMADLVARYPHLKR